MELAELKDLTGWSVVVWYELRLSTDEAGGYKVGGYFTDTDLASATGKGEGWYGNDGRVVEVYVLVDPDGLSGFVLGTPAQLSHETVLREEVKNAALAKLTPAEKKILGLE